MNFLATLGDFNDDGNGRIVKIELESEKIYEVLNYEPPESLKVPGKGFTGAIWNKIGDKVEFLVCGFNATYRFNPINWKLIGIIHQPCMNDLHHINIYESKIYIVNTGFDRIDVLNKDYNYIGGYSLEPAWITSQRYSGINPSKNSWEKAFLLNQKEIDRELKDEGPPQEQYFKSNQKDLPFHQRKINDFVHPNHISFIEDNMIVTRFSDCSIQNLKNWEFIIKKTPGFPHDGRAFDNIFWITCTNGLVIGYDIENNIPNEKIIEQINVFDITPYTGWLRGLHINDEYLVLGLTKISRMPRYRWSNLPFEQTETSIIAIDRNTKKLLYHVDLAEFGSHPKIFEIIEAII